jgi:hypothetical protein
MSEKIYPFDADPVADSIQTADCIQYGTGSRPDFSTWFIFDLIVVESRYRLEEPYELSLDTLILPHLVVVNLRHTHARTEHDEEKRYRKVEV